VRAYELPLLHHLVHGRHVRGVNLTQVCVDLTQLCVNLTQVCVNLTWSMDATFVVVLEAVRVRKAARFAVYDVSATCNTRRRLERSG
jgi:hypothetical protein